MAEANEKLVVALDKLYQQFCLVQENVTEILDLESVVSDEASHSKFIVVYEKTKEIFEEFSKIKKEIDKRIGSNDKL